MGKVWRVDTGARHRGSMKMTFVAVALVSAMPVAALTLGADLQSFQQTMQKYGFLLVLGFLALAYLPYLLRKKKDDAAWLRLEHGRLRFEGPKTSKELDLAGAQLSLARVSVNGQFFGSLLTAHAPHTGVTMRMFGHGAQLAPGAYNGGEAPYPTDAWMIDRGAFGELVAALGGPASAEQALQQPAPQPATSAQHATYRAQPAASEQVFELSTPSSVALYVGGGFLPFLLMIGAVVVMKSPWTTNPLPGLGVLAVLALLTVAAGLGVRRGLRKRRHGRVYLRFSNAALVLEGAKGEIFRADAPPQVEMLVWKDHWIHQRRYVRGAALRLTNARGESVTLGVADPPAVRGGAQTTSEIDFILSADAGQALMQHLGVS